MSKIKAFHLFVVIIISISCRVQAKELASVESISFKRVSAYSIEGFRIADINNGKKYALERIFNGKSITKKFISKKEFNTIHEKIKKLQLAFEVKKNKCSHFIEFSFGPKKTSSCLDIQKKSYSIYSKLVFELNLRFAEKKKVPVK